MHCLDCGTANTVDSKYCKECGSKINEGFRTMMLSVQDLPVQESDANVERLTRLLDMAFWHNQAGNVDAAITASEAALAINPRSTTAHSLLGSLYEKRGLDELAIEHFEAVLALNPDSAADSLKLDQLRRGVHVRAVTPPAAHLWLPPGLVKALPKFQKSWASLTESSAQGALPRKPLIAAAAAFALVLAFGLLLTRPWARAETVTTYPITPTTVPPPAVSVDRSAYAGNSGMEIGAVKPIIMPGSAESASAYPPAPALTMHDPFAGVVPAAPPAPRVAASPTWFLPPVPRQRRLAHRNLPILPLSVTPISDAAEGLAPAPVAVPDGVRPIASVADIPQHTVVVNSVGSGYAPSVQPADSVTAMPSRITITVHQIKPSDADPAPTSWGGGANIEAATGDKDQQRALALQQQGEYRQARLAYQNAIRAYQAQVASGNDVETAQRGLAACQIGLQICQQSQ